MSQFGRMLLVFGAALLLIGGALILADKVGLGRLPGDLSLRFKNVSIHVPIVTSILVSVVLTVLLNLWWGRR